MLFYGSFRAMQSSVTQLSRGLIEDVENQKLVSIASLWEIAIKVSIGRLDIGMSMAELVEREVLGNTFDVLAAQPSHLGELVGLPFHHKDPFDRLILSQSLAENIPVVSIDKVFKSYATQLLW